MKCFVFLVELVMSELQGREIDRCPQCRELFKIIERNMTKQEPLAGGH